MKLSDYPDINERRKNEILSMSDAELIIEIEKGPRSRMPKCIPFMIAVLHERDSVKEEDLLKAEKAHQEAMLSESQRANENSRRANWISLAALAVAIIALLISYYS